MKLEQKDGHPFNLKRLNRATTHFTKSYQSFCVKKVSFGENWFD